MKKTIDIIFQVCGDLQSLDNEDCNWYDFINNIIDNGSNRITPYFILKHEDDLDINKKIATKVKRKMHCKQICFCDYVVPNDIEKDSLVLHNIKTNEKISFNKDNSIVFTTSIRLLEMLYMQNIFSVFLNIDENKYDEKEIKQIYKLANIFITADEVNKFSFESINYEFLTFLEKNEN